MQEHVQLEVSLEVIMAEIANKMTELSQENGEVNKKEKKAELQKLIYLQENAYKGDRKSIREILDREFV